MRFVLFICASLSFVAGFAGDRSDIDPGLVELVEKIDEKASNIVTLRAHFVQRKEISLLTEPVEMEGSFLIKKPDGIKFDFDPKEDLILIVNKDEMISLSHKAKKANRIKMKKRKTDLTRGILSEKIKTLLGYFNLTRASGSNGNHLVLTPTKRKLKKKFKDVQIWVNNDHLIYKIKVTLKDGDVYELTLSDIELNVDLDSEEFDTTIPEGYELGDRMEYIFGSNVAF